MPWPARPGARAPLRVPRAAQATEERSAPMTALSVVGCGYLGAVHSACMAQMGHDVIGVDIDAAKVEALNNGTAPFFEPGFPEMLSAALASGRLRFSSDPGEVHGRQVHFVCVGTPQKRGEYAADMRYVNAAVETIIPALRAGDLVVGKSTVPVGTARRLADRITETVPGALLAWNPEFLREGHAVADTMHPDRIVYGLPGGPDAEVARRLLDEVYQTPLSEGVPQVVTDYATAELVKAAANSFLATKISFINAMAEVCEANSADVRDSPALNVAAQMTLQGASVVVTDPQALNNAQRAWPDLAVAKTAEEAADQADLVMLLTEWDEYRRLDPVSFGAVVAQRRILDGRNALDPASWRGAGWTYRALGRP